MSDLTNEQVAAIAALCEEHKRIGCPGVVLPVVQVEALVSAYRSAQTVRRQGLYAIDLDDREMVRSLLNQLPTGGVGKLWPGE